MTEPIASVQHTAPESGSTVEPIDDLRCKIARAVCDAEWGDGHWDSDALSQDERASYEAMAGAAIPIVWKAAMHHAHESFVEDPPFDGLEVLMRLDRMEFGP